MSTVDDVRELQDIIKEEYGRELTEGEVAVILQRFLLLYELIYQRHESEEVTPHSYAPPSVLYPPQ